MIARPPVSLGRNPLPIVLAPTDRSWIVAVWSVIAAVSLLAFSGCGGGEPSPTQLENATLNPVKGSVVTADGKPLTEGTITFVPIDPKKPAAVGKIGSDGSFTLKSGDRGEGAAEGKYRVRVESALTVPGSDPKKPTRVVPLAYEDEDTSRLEITIKSGANTLDPIKLVPVKKPAAGRAAGGRPD